MLWDIKLCINISFKLLILCNCYITIYQEQYLVCICAVFEYIHEFQHCLSSLGHFNLYISVWFYFNLLLKSHIILIKYCFIVVLLYYCTYMHWANSGGEDTKSNQIKFIRYERIHQTIHWRYNIITGYINLNTISWKINK